MKIRFLPQLRLVAVIIASIILSACSPALNAGISIPAAHQPDNIVTNENKDQSQNFSPAALEDNQEDTDISVPEGMVAFEGIVFVATTEPDVVRWQSAGWRVSKKSFRSDDDQLPSDCTLYPHKGVENQWIGNCYGSILIPSDGALNIAIMHTGMDGSTTLVQVAPPQDIVGP